MRRRIQVLEGIVAEFVREREIRSEQCTKSAKPRRSPPVQVEPIVNSPIIYATHRPKSRVSPEGVAGLSKPRVLEPVVEPVSITSASLRAALKLWNEPVIRGVVGLWSSTIWACAYSRIPGSAFAKGIPLGKPLAIFALASAASALLLAYASIPDGYEDGAEASDP